MAEEPDEVAGLLAAMPEAEESQQAVVGVPKGYTADLDIHDNSIPWMQRAASSATGYTVPARYTAEDIWRPANYAPGKIATIQSSMMRAGMYKPGAKFRLGVWDAASRSAWKEVLSIANASGKTPDTTIQAQAGLQTAGSGLAKVGVTGTSASRVVPKQSKSGAITASTEEELGAAPEPTTSEASVETPPDLSAMTYRSGFGE